jgi:hypothetical protein
MNCRLMLERLAEFFGGIAAFPDSGQQQQIETISAVHAPDNEVTD